MTVNEKAKLLLVADTYYPKVDGTLIFMEQFLKRASSNFDISLLVPKLDKTKKETKGKHKITFLQPSRWLKLSGYPSLKLSWKNFKKIKQAVQQTDILFIQGPALISFIGILYGRKYHKKIVYYTHVLSWELFAKFMPAFIHDFAFRTSKKITLWLYNKCDEIAVPYHELKEQLKRAGVKVAMSVARLGVAINQFSPTHDKRLSKMKVGIKSDKSVIGYVGRISKEKNVDILREAFLKLEKQRNLKLLIVGDGAEENKEEFKKLNNCKITGFVNNVQDYLKAMDVFVMPSLTETTSLATLEAMSCGLPVIVTKVGFMKKYIVKDHNGLFFPRNNSTMLAMKIKKLLDDQDLSHKLGKNARKTVAYSFSWERSINKVKRILLRQHLEM